MATAAAKDDDDDDDDDDSVDVDHECHHDDASFLSYFQETQLLFAASIMSFHVISMAFASPVSLESLEIPFCFTSVSTLDSLVPSLDSSLESSVVSLDGSCKIPIENAAQPKRCNNDLT